MDRITSQTHALTELYRHGEIIGAQLSRYESGGAQIKADAARRIAAAHRDRAAVWSAVVGLYRGRKAAADLGKLSAADARLVAEQGARTWTDLADAHQRDADRIEQAAAMAFGQPDGTDGTTYVPGRGRLRVVESGGHTRTTVDVITLGTPDGAA